MSRISNRIGSRYDDILSYFKRYPFGSIPPDMTVLSVLPPIDRCLILERVFERGDAYELALIDKLSMAYMKAGWLDLGRLFLENCYEGGFIDDDIRWELDKKISDLSNLRCSSTTYEDALYTLPQYEVWGGDFCRLIRTLCEDYIDMNVLQEVDPLSPAWSSDILIFKKERVGFIRRVGGIV